MLWKPKVISWYSYYIVVICQQKIYFIAICYITDFLLFQKATPLSFIFFFYKGSVKFFSPDHLTVSFPDRSICDHLGEHMAGASSVMWNTWHKVCGEGASMNTLRGASKQTLCFLLSRKHLLPPKRNAQTTARHSHLWKKTVGLFTEHCGECARLFHVFTFSPPEDL